MLSNIWGQTDQLSDGVLELLEWPFATKKLSQNSDPTSPEDKDKTSFKLSRSDWGEGHKENVNGK